MSHEQGRAIGRSSSPRDPSQDQATIFGGDVQSTLDLALKRTSVARVQVRHRPRLLSDNGPAYVSSALLRYLDSIGMTHTRGAPYHPMTQGKIERWHRSMKNVVKLEHYYSPGALKAAIGQFVHCYNNRR